MFCMILGFFFERLELQLYSYLGEGSEKRGFLSLLACLGEQDACSVIYIFMRDLCLFILGMGYPLIFMMGEEHMVHKYFIKVLAFTAINTQ